VSAIEELRDRMDKEPLAKKELVSVVTLLALGLLELESLVAEAWSLAEDAIHRRK
jgi:hypothetical protein